MEGVYVKTEPEPIPHASTSEPPVPLAVPLEAQPCRLCANIPDRAIEIYSTEGLSNQLSDRINEYLPVKVSPDDKLPLCCCWTCVTTLLSFHELVVACVEAEKRLQIIEPPKPILVPALPDPEPDIVEFNDDDAEMMDADDGEGDIDGDDDYEPENEDDDEESEEETKPIPGTSDDTESKFLDLNTSSEKRPDSNEQDPNRDIIFETKILVMNHEMSDDETSDRETSDYKTSIHETPEHERPDHETSDHETSDHETSDHETSDYKTSIHERPDHETLDHETSDYKTSDIKPAKRIKRFFCPVCSKGFGWKHDMHRHKRTKHVEGVVEEENSPNRVRLRCLVQTDDSRHYKCDECGMVFKKGHSLTNHYTVHTGQRPFICHTCKKTFRLSSVLTRHIKNAHMGIKTFGCGVCGKVFAMKDTRDQHMNIHTDTRPFECDICGRPFRQRATMKTHKKTHDANSLRFECNVCGARFRRGPEWFVHQVTHKT